MIIIKFIVYECLPIIAIGYSYGNIDLDPFKSRFGFEDRSRKIVSIFGAAGSAACHWADGCWNIDACLRHSQPPGRCFKQQHIDFDKLTAASEGWIYHILPSRKVTPNEKLGR